MKRFDLGMSINYCPQWGVVEAVREFFQNGIDEERANEDHKFYWEYDEHTQELVVGNENCKLDTKTLLLGATTKTGKADMIGQHGEGYKVATVVLMRLGKEVVIYNRKANEQWVSKVIKSRRYGADVVVFDISKIDFFNRITSCSLVFSVKGITPEEFESIRQSNLHLQDKPEGVIHTKYGDIFTDEEHSGRLYVGGLLVTRSKYATYGYNFNPEMVRLDRDRSIMDNIDTQFLCSKTISASQDVDFILEARSIWDGRYLHFYTSEAKDNQADLFDKAYEEFVAQHGEDAIPVSDQDTFNRLARNGYKPVLLPDTSYHFISSSTRYVEPSAVTESEGERYARLLCDWFDKYQGEENEWYKEGSDVISKVCNHLTGVEE